MSKYRHWWYRVVVNAIRQYPELKQKKNDLQKINVTPAYAPTIRGSETGRTTETAALKQLPPAEEMWVDAVELAMEEVLRHRDGKEVMAVVELVDFKRTHSVEGAALALNMGYATAWRRRSRFVYIVAKKAGYL